MRPPPSGHMIINMKTTITTHGAHNGVIVHAGVQSGPGSSQGQGSQWYVPSQFPQIETPGGTRSHPVAPGTSQENLATSWPALHINTTTSSPQPEQQRQSRQDRSPQLEQQRQSLQDRSPQARRMSSPPPSPVYSFTGRDSPPDEFIQPTKVTLNVFNPQRSDPVQYETSIRRSNPETADALINDSVTTTTTVEVFRTPLDPAHPDRVVALPPAPVPSIDDRPQLLRVNGPGYEKWTSQRTETLINDRPVQTQHQHGKAVQWKETLVDTGSSCPRKVTLYDPYSGPRSPFANAVTTPHQPSPHQYQLPTVNTFDERILPRPSSGKPPYTVHSPSEFSQVSHPVITSSSEDLSRPPFPKSPVPSAPTTSCREVITHPAIPDTSLDYRGPPAETSILQPPVYTGYEQVVRRVVTLPPAPKDSYPGPSLIRSQTSPLYVEPNRARHAKPAEPSTSNRYRSVETSERYRSAKRSQSSHRRRREHQREEQERQRHRSESPAYRQRYTPAGHSTVATVSPGGYDDRPDPNRLPGEGPTRANSREIFRLYQTRDILQNVVAQFDALGYGFSDGLVLSPMAESEDSVISELSSRADRTRSDILETKDQENKEEDKPRPLHRTNRATSSDDLYEELDHIYEDLDNYRSKSIVTPEQSDSSSTVKEGDTTSEAEESSGYAPIHEVIEQLKTPDVEQAEHQQQLQRPEMMSSEYRPIARVRKAHPNGLVFPRITATVPTLPELPEEHEITTIQPVEESVGIKLTPEIPYVDDSPRVSVEHIMPSDLTSTKEESKKAELKSQAQVVADQHKLVIRGWESLISDSEESC